MCENSRKNRWDWPAAALAVGMLLCSTASAWADGATSTASLQAAGITLTARAGFDGYYKDSQWTPIRVTIANDGPDMSGTLQVKVPHNNSETLYTRPVDLPTQSRREIFFYVPPEGYLNSGSLKIDLVAGNRLLASVSVRLTQAAQTDYIYGILAGSTSAYNSLSDIDPINGQGYVARLDPGDLPPLAAGWKALDVLVISDVDTGTFSPEQRQALEDWVQQGGRLVVVGGPNWQKNSAGLDSLLPLAASGIQSVVDLRPLGSFAAAIAPDGPALVATGQLTPDAITLVKTEGLPAVAYRRLGLGLVAYLAFDPALAPLKGWDGVTGIFRGLLTISLDRPGWANGFFNWSSADEAARAVPGLAVPSAWQVCGFLTVYVIVIGPLNFLVLRRLKRRGWAWITIPGIVLLFSAGAYLAGHSLLGTQAILNRLAVVEVWPNAERAQAEQIVGLFSPARTTYALTFEPSTLAKPIPYNGGMPSLAPLVVEQGDRTRLPAIQTEIGAVQAFIAEGQVSAPRFDANLTIHLSNNAAAGPAMIAGTLTNHSDLTLADTVLLFPGGFMRMANFEPGQTVTVSRAYISDSRAAPANPTNLSSTAVSAVFPKGKTPSPYPGTDSTFTDILGTTYPTNQEQYRRNALLSAVLDQYSGKTRGQGIYLVGWTSTSPLGATVSVPFRTLDMSLYFIALPYTLDAGQGLIILPPGLLTWTALDSLQLAQGDSTPYDTNLDPSNEIGFEFAPRLPVPFASVQALTLHLLSQGVTGPAATVRVQLYDFTENTWVEPPGVVWGDTPIAAPARFVGPNHNVLVRIKNLSGTGQNVVAVDFTLEAER